MPFLSFQCVWYNGFAKILPSSKRVEFVREKFEEFDTRRICIVVIDFILAVDLTETWAATALFGIS